MTHLSQFPNAENMLEGVPPASGGSRFANRMSSIVTWIGDCIETMAKYYAAAAMYEQLTRLSDAELQRRGLSREKLARDVLAARDRAERSD